MQLLKCLTVSVAFNMHKQAVSFLFESFSWINRRIDEMTRIREQAELSHRI